MFRKGNLCVRHVFSWRIRLCQNKAHMGDGLEQGHCKGLVELASELMDVGAQHIAVRRIVTPEHLFKVLAADNGWRCRVGGEDAEILTVVESFMAVAVPAGTGEMVLTFVPEGLEIGSALTGLGTLGFLALLIWEIKKKQWLFPSLLKKAVEVLFGALWLGGTALVYLLPLGYAIVNLFQ